MIITMKKRWFKAAAASMLALGLLLSPLAETGGTASAAATNAVSDKAERIQLWVDGKQINLNSPIYKSANVAVAPMKQLLDALYVSSVLEEKTGTIIIRDIGVTITMSVGVKEAVVNGKTVTLGGAAVIKDGIPYVPVRAVSELLGASVDWDEAAGAIRIKSKYYYDEEEYGEPDPADSLPELTATEIVDLYDESVVMIMTNRSQGSGIVIGDDLILTNYHVIENATSATAHSIYYDEIKVTGVVAFNEAADLAIIRTAEPLDLNLVEASYQYRARKGDRVYAIGSPYGLQNTFSEGLVSNLHYEGGVSYIQTNAPVDQGSSGGALFNAYGQFVGIVAFGYDNSVANLNFAVSAFHAAVLLNSITDEQLKQAAFLPPKLPDTLAGASMNDIQKLMKAEFSTVDTTAGQAAFTKWEAKRDAEGWLVLTANIDPLFYLYAGVEAESELRYWSVNMAHELHRMLPDDRIQVTIFFERDYGFQPRGFAQGEVTAAGNGKWRVRYAVIDMQLKDQMYIKSRF